MSFREKFQWYTILVGMGIFQACASNDSFEGRALTCDPLTPASSCAGASRSSLYVSIPEVQAGQEYVVVIHSPNFMPLLERNQHEILVTSNLYSNFAPDWEIRQQRILSQNSSSHPTNALSATVSGEIKHETRMKDMLSQFYESHFVYDEDLKNYKDEESVYSSDTTFNRADNRDNNWRTKKFLREANDRQSPAREVSNFILHQDSNQFEILFDERLRDDRFRKESFLKNTSCIQQQFEWMFEILGKPVDLDRKEAIEILVTSLGGGPSGGSALGFFNPIDRFLIDDPKSGVFGNFAELIYLSPFIKPDMICATAAHELQHLLNFDSKITKALPVDLRGNFDAPALYSLSQEHHGLNEAYSHLIEMLSGEAKAHTHQILFQILRNPHQSTRALELTGHNIYSNFRTRGLNLLIVLHALKRFGGSLSWEDPKTQKFLQSTIASRDTGIENLAKLFNESERDHLRKFFEAWVLASFSDEGSNKLLPTHPESPDLGIQFLNRSDEVEEPQDFRRRRSFRNRFHPIETQVPMLQTAQAWQALSHSISMFRMIVPDEHPSPEHSSWQLEVKSPSSAVEFFVIRVR